MRRLGLFALLGLLVLTTSTAFATSLKVEAGVLQAWTFDVDLHDCEEHPEAPHCDEEDSVAINFEIKRYAGNSGNHESIETLGPYLIPDGARYHVEWSGSERNCASVPPQPNGTGGPFVAGDSGFTHTLCVQKSQPRGTLTVTLDDGSVVEPLAGRPWGLSSTSASLCDGFEDASFCGGPSDR